MSAETDRIIDRRRLKRSLTLWRVLAIVAIVATGLVALARFDMLPDKPHVAVLNIDGLILDDTQRNDVLRGVAEDENAKALVLRIDSPGGTFVGGETLYNAIRDVAAEKPVVALIGNTGTSAAYMAAIASNRILVHEGSITGSIGVLMQSADVTGLMDMLGITPQIVKSDEMKAQPNPMEPFSPQARDMIAGVIGDLHDIFVSMVSERRSMGAERSRVLSDGRVFTGRQALAAGLVDGVGDERDARDWLAEAHDVGLDLPRIDVTPHDKVASWQDVLTGSIGKTLVPERLSLDGVLALWHPQLNL